MQLPRSLSEAVWGCKCPPQSFSSSDDSSDSSKRCELKQLRRCLLWSLVACVLVLFCLGLLMLVEFVVVHPRPPECDVVSLNLKQFSASTANSNISLEPQESNKTKSRSEHGAGEHERAPIQLLTAVMDITLRASNQIERIGTFYDHVHVMVLYNGDVVGEGLVGPFFQGRKISSLLHTQVEAHKLAVRQDTSKQLLTDISDHEVDFQVKVHVLTRVRILKCFSHHFRVHVCCDITLLMDLATKINSTVLAKRCISRE